MVVAAGVVSFLEEDDTQLKVRLNRMQCIQCDLIPSRSAVVSNLQVRALHKIYQIIDVHWAEICESLPLIEGLSEDDSFPAHDLAAAIASKCFYHLQEYNDALRLALSAGKYFDVSTKNEYIETMLSHCIDQYKSLRVQLLKDRDAAVTIDPRMEAIIEQMFQRCYRDLCFEQALGVALDTHRIDKVIE